MTRAIFLVAEVTLATLVAAGWIYWIIAWGCVRRFARRCASCRQIQEIDWPMVSVLKPLKGHESQLFENLATFCRQDYPSYELLLGVADGDDPAVAAVRELKRSFPNRQIRLIVTSALGLNPKSAVLHELSIAALGEVLVISDSDIRVERDYLKRVVRGLEDRSVGIVTCIYRGEGAQNVLGQIAASHVNQEFFPSAMVASEIKGVHYSFGATMALRAYDLARAGGFAVMADYLADDYELGRRITSLGLQVRLSECVVGHIEGVSTAGGLWNRELRWARTIRTIAPWSYLGLVVTYSIPLGIGLTLVSGFAWWALATAAATLAMGYAIAWDIARKVQLGTAAWLPARQFLSLVIWATGLVGRRVVWRGHSYRLLDNGQLAPWSPPRIGFRGVVAALTRRVDAWLRRRDGIVEFTDNPKCIFRIRFIEASRHVQLNDGMSVKPGDPVVELHLWNEHVPRMNDHGADIAWASATNKRLVGSLNELADYLERQDPSHSIKGICGLASMVIREPAQLHRMDHGYGFEFHGRQQPRGVLQWVHRLGENMLIWGIVQTFNPGARRTGKFMRARHVVWISRGTLVRRYRPAQDAATRKRRSVDRLGREYEERLAAVAARRHRVRQHGEEQ